MAINLIQNAAIPDEKLITSDKHLLFVLSHIDNTLPYFAATLDAMGVAVPFSIEVISPELAALDLQNAAKLSFDTTRSCFS